MQELFCYSPSAAGASSNSLVPDYLRDVKIDIEPEMQPAAAETGVQPIKTPAPKPAVPSLFDLPKFHYEIDEWGHRILIAGDH